MKPINNKKFHWGEKPYYSLDYYLKQTFEEKIYKLALDGGMSCPNRDGTVGIGGCVFCSHGGSGDFAEPLKASVTEQIEEAKKRVSSKIKSGRYIAYFQAYTNTYAPVSYLKPLFYEAISHKDIVALSIGTRPDCLSEEVVDLLAQLNREKPVWIELGLQTIHEGTAQAINRGYNLTCFTDSVNHLKEAGLTVIVHVILGLPGESREMMLDTVRFLGSFHPKIDGIKLQLLHLLKDTKLAVQYRTAPFPIMTMEEYVSLVLDCVRLLPPDIVIHRISGDGPKKILMAPLWSGNKRLVLNSMAKAFKEAGAYQGELYIPK